MSTMPTDAAELELLLDLFRPLRLRYCPLQPDRQRRKRSCGSTTRRCSTAAAPAAASPSRC